MRAVEHKEVDKIPTYFRAEPAILKMLEEKLALKDMADIRSYFKIDAFQIPGVYRKNSLSDPDRSGCYTDMFGIKKQIITEGNISSTKIIQHCFSYDSTIDDIKKWNFPTEEILDLPACKKESQDAYKSGLAIYGGVWASIFTNARALMGEDDFLMSLIGQPDVAVALVDRLTNSYLTINEAYLATCSEYLDIYYMGSDFGAQNSLFISRDMFRQFFMPNLKKLVDQAKKYDLKVMQHTCGAVNEIIPDLIEIGVDILDPVQVSAHGMSPENLLQYKGKIAFHGGVSTQKTLPFKDVETVQNEITETIKTLGPTGFIAAPDQNIIDNTPLENIIIMYQCINDYKL